MPFAVKQIAVTFKGDTHYVSPCVAEIMKVNVVQNVYFRLDKTRSLCLAQNRISWIFFIPSAKNYYSFIQLCISTGRRLLHAHYAEAGVIFSGREFQDVFLASIASGLLIKDKC